METDTIANMERVNNTDNFWGQANDFVKTFVPEDFEQRFIAFCKERNYNRNEMQFLKLMVGQALEFNCTMAILKNDCAESVAKRETNEKDNSK